MVWIHGGGFANGAKSTVGNPSELIAHSVRNGLGGMVYVQMNYRLGVFGFPPKGPMDTDVDTNAGLFDQNLALQWVQQNIRAFGGDPNQVTVMGESAGAVSIWSQMTAFGTTFNTTLFNRAILQSPAQRPNSDAALYAQVFQQFVAASNVSSVSAARMLDTGALQNINRLTIGAAPFATLTYGPNVDNDFIPAPQTVLLSQNRFARNVDTIVAHNANEGLIFTDSRIQNTTGLAAYVTGLMPSAPPVTIQNVVTNLYPEDFTGTFGYTTELERTEVLASEALVTCNANALLKAFASTPASQSRTANGTANGYLFAVSPGIHALDTSYTFFNGPFTDIFGDKVDENLANQMQSIFVNFAITGQKDLRGPAPSGGSVAALTPTTLLSLNINQTVLVEDPANSARCSFWQTALG